MKDPQTSSSLNPSTTPTPTPTPAPTPAPSSSRTASNASRPGSSLGGGKARRWFLDAFNRLALRQGYQRVSVYELSRRAGVGRSTFYEHFRDKDEVLRTALEPLLIPLAAAATGRGEVTKVAFVLDHIAENRVRALELLLGPGRLQMESALAELILAWLDTRADVMDPKLRALDAAGRVGAQIAILLAWVRDGYRLCSSAEVAKMLVQRGSSD